MGKLTNRFSWSTSAAQDFETCRRKRYWGKYAMWNGWDPQAAEIQRRAYRLSKMDNRYTLRGSAVERAVLWVLRQKQQGRGVSTEDAYEQVAKPFLNKAWKDSREKLWQANPKQHTCLHEHYYPALHTVPEKEWTARLGEETRRCISNFIDRVLPRLAEITRAQEVEVASPGQGGDPECFEWGGLKIYAIPDYVYQLDDRWCIHDWKTGKGKADHREQVALYGLWAHQKHGVPPEHILVFLEYLLEGVVAYEPLDREKLEAVKQRIEGSVADMSEYLAHADRGRNEPLPKEEWELAPTRSPCRLCNFYELCEPEFGEEKL